ncbi:hypothetical protein BN7_1136 [Wickerhamomyces ciferrii]|uniref:C2H2-type domain-containing protein n=1 Tax=Wickerhamomyces ciferrii (strain ATCC 14091 / BCRC 22168 / CBS 111 / JCM 3599 / NBRC 0793 / NRRL Y-1031 F-60-10) TaxID=1206466 RepID=K0K9K4_WICCF|nr:uncharacterized protein BN7_1136 [Wickerhamomyces ciferrii]CCH41595.1 hypothetical protein BN7_1136 [Wickerhamomyces ciferrii]
MTSTHNPNNHLSRRASISTAPYQIPQRHNSISHSPLSPPNHSNIHIPQHHNRQLNHGQSTGNNQYLSNSVPTLSREFVVRRISEGESGRLKEELKCEACGKGYKHISSLAKHLWEHTPEWNVTKKLLISKHQQVQLLEAASILVSMNELDEMNEMDPIQEEKESSIKFNPKYTENDEGEDDDDEDDSRFENSPSPYLKNHRYNSISQFPPSESNGNLNSPINKKINGGFLDVPKSTTIRETKKSISEPLEKVDEKEKDGEKEDEKDVDDGVFGMD